MTSPNTSESSQESAEGKNKIKPEKKYNASGLLDEAISREFGNPIHPEKFDTYKAKRDTYNENVRIHMRDLRRENKKDWGEVNDEDIESIGKDSEILEQIARRSKGLILSRKRAFDRAIELFPTLKTQRADWATILSTSLASFNEQELKDSITRSALMRKHVRKYFPQLGEESASEIRDFDRIFGKDKDIYLKDEKDKIRFAHIHKNHATFRQVPDWEDMEFILSVYAEASNDRKKEILTSLSVILTVRQAYDLGLIDQSFLEVFAEKELGDVYRKLPSEDQKSFIRSLSKDESYSIGAGDFDTSRLGQIIQDEAKRRSLSKEIVRGIVIDESEAEKIVESKGPKNYSELLESLAKKVGAKGKLLVEDIEKMKTPGSVLVVRHPEHGTQYLRIKKFEDGNGKPLWVNDRHENGVEVEWLLGDGKSIRNSTKGELSYKALEDFLSDIGGAQAITGSEFDSLLVTDSGEAAEGKIYDARDLELAEVNAGNIAEKLNALDPIGANFGFETGTAFIAPAEDEKGGKYQKEVWTVDKVYDDKVDLRDSNGIQLPQMKGYPLSNLYAFLKSTSGFERIAKIRGDDDMLKELKEKEFGVDGQAVLNDGQIIVKEKDDHGHELEKPITSFSSEKGGHIRVEFIRDGMVRFGDYDDSGDDIQKAQEYAKKHGLKKALKGYYSWQTMSYPAFLKYLEKNELKASTKDLIDPQDAGHDTHEHHAHAHTERSLLKRIMKWQNPASIWKGFEMIWHGIEHTLEKGAKLDAARFAMKTSSFFHLPDGVNAQIYSDITNASKEIIEKYEQKIFGLPGPAGRWKCIHIVHNLDSRPEEVVSAINYMLKSYGHLYSEDIKHFQPVVNKHNLETADKGYFAFLDGFIVTSKLGDLKHWRMKAYKKAIAEMGSEENHENEPTEEQLIHALFKTIDGNWGDFPYAASVVKGNGGPSGFEKNWKFEGYDNAYKKGKDQTQMVNADGRLNKALGYFDTHEIYKAVGAMEMVAAKTKEPEFQAMPFVWAVGGYSRFASHTALQKLKTYAEQGLSLHAFAFLRNSERNDIYRDTVRLALKDMGGSDLVGEFDTLLKKLEFDPNNPEKTKGAAKAMGEFWKKYSKLGLHDRLQGHTGWLTKMAKDGNGTVKKYLEILDGAHSMALKDDTIPSSEYGMDWYKEHGYQNLITASGENGLRSLGSMLNKIRFEGTAPGGRPMNEEHRQKIWNYTTKYMNTSLRDTKGFLGDEALQREQFLLHRRELIQFFTEKLSARMINARETNASQIIQENINTYPYYKDLAEMGIDPHAVFDGDLEKKNAQADYERWKNNDTAGSISIKRETPSVQDMTARRTQKAIIRDEKDIHPAGPRLKGDSFDHTKEPAWKDPDLQEPGGSADASDTSGD